LKSVKKQWRFKEAGGTSTSSTRAIMQRTVFLKTTNVSKWTVND